MRRIRCSKCGNSERFTILVGVRVTAEVTADGEQVGGADYANELRGQWLSCPECGQTWKTSRYIPIDVDVR